MIAIRRSLALAPCLLLITATFVAAAANAAPAIPKLEGRVNDYAHVLSPQQKSELEAVSKNEEDKTSNQIVVLTIPSLDGDTIEDYAVRVFKAWKLGQKGHDNGVLVVAAIADHKMRIEVGYGLEGALTDATASEIIRNEMTPRFRAGDYGGGFLAGVNAVEKAIHGEYKAVAAPHHMRNVPHPDVGTLLFWMIFFIVLLVSHVRFHRYRNHWIGPYWIPTGSGGFSGGFSGGGFSGGGGGFSGGGGGSGGGGASGGW